ncbi:MAG: ASCH domain-containing protein [Gemmataceae bacterium]
MAAKVYALSLKQPWATLLVHGLKTIEIRRWPTNRRGRVLIHASRTPDERPEAWARVPAALLEHACWRGGIVGEGTILECIAYVSLESFLKDQDAHLNDPAWFQAGLYGFRFANLAPLPFRPCLGWVRFFAVDHRGNTPAPGSRRKRSSSNP